MAEKWLFEIAVERIIDRIGKLPRGDQNFVIETLANAARNPVDRNDGGRVREQMASELVRVLFPELKV